MICHHSSLSTFFPYTTLFRSALLLWGCANAQGQATGTTLFVDGLVTAQSQSQSPRSLAQSDPIYERDQITTHRDRKSTRLNSSHVAISYAVFCLKKKN